MKNRSERLLTIRKLIRNQRIASQEELLKGLQSEGFEMTQATLSRDLKYLRVSKVHDEMRGYIYDLSDGDQTGGTPWTSFLVEGFQSIEFAQGMGIIRTLPGYASSIASAIDSMSIPEIAGTVAGDDTIFMVPRDGARREQILKALSRYIPNLKS
jgi:transcriptional regulator of arginine metabolism